MGRPTRDRVRYDLDVGGMVADQLVQAGCFAVLSVASTAMRPLLGFCAAGLMPGSTPTTGMPGCAARRASTAAAVAVLQATTSRWQPMPAKVFADRQHAALDLGFALVAVGDVGGVGVSSGNPIAAGLDQRGQYRQAAKAGIEDADHESRRWRYGDRAPGPASGDGLRNLADLRLPFLRPGDVHRGALGIDGDGDRHVLHVEFVDRFHAEVGEADDLGRLDRLGTR
jgi:hypothetical protein